MNRAGERPTRAHKPFWRTRTLRYTVITSSAIAGVLLFLLASATSNSPFLERYYPILLALNALTAVAMLAIVGALVWRLGKRYRAGQFGARLMARFALAFALMGVVPGALIYLVSVQFLSRSIDTWFDVRVDKALEAGLALGRTTLDGMLSELNAKARTITNALSDIPESEQSFELSRQRDKAGVQQALLFTAGGRVIAAALDAAAADAGESALGSFRSELPPVNVMRQLRQRHGYASVESMLSEAGQRAETDAARAGSAVAGAASASAGGRPATALQMRVIVPVPQAGLGFDSDRRYLQLVQRVPQALADTAEEVQTGARDYQELSLSRSGLRKIFAVTLTLALLLSVFAALASAFVLASWLTAPLLQLAEATRAVASGDYSPMHESHTRDELGSLTQSFNAMTRQLEEARTAVERNRIQLENAKTSLESILANMSAGVLVLDESRQIVQANHAADSILGISFSDHLGKRLGAVAGLANLDAAIEHGRVAESELGAAWQKQIALARPEERGEGEGSSQTPGNANDREPLTLLARGSRCPVGSGEEVNEGYLVVFDDVSDLIAAQRSVAWGEVARRLAHEIKNPLTPIQLSAERLRMKLHSRLDKADGEVLERSVSTIINQVGAMKHMVDDFRDYAKTPIAAMAAVDLNALIVEVLTLYGAEGPDSGAAIEARLAGNLPMILGDATRLRQVIHNLVQNAQDATHGAERPKITVQTERVDSRVATGSVLPGVLRNPREPTIRLTIRDNGAGFPTRILNRVFEPYVTTKARGTGLGLAVVKKIAEEHEARIEAHNSPEGGAVVTLLFTRLAGQQLQVA